MVAGIEALHGFEKMPGELIRFRFRRKHLSRSGDAFNEVRIHIGIIQFRRDVRNTAVYLDSCVMQKI